MPRHILRIIALPLVLAVGTSATVAAQSPFYDPALPIWGVYATGVGYRVNSPAMVERANYEGISIECFKTMTVTVMPGALIPPDDVADYWLAKNITAGLVETKATGLTWWEAQARTELFTATTGIR